MKKLTVWLILSIFMLLCGCKTASTEPTVSKPTMNSRVENVSPIGETSDNGLSASHQKTQGPKDSFSAHRKVSLEQIVTLIYKSGDTEIEQQLNDEESAIIISLLTARREKSDATTDAFRDDVCFEISGYRFNIATDQSGYILNCETGRYIFLSEEKRLLMEDILAGYGAVFPCD